MSTGFIDEAGHLDTAATDRNSSGIDQRGEPLATRRTSSRYDLPRIRLPRPT